MKASQGWFGQGINAQRLALAALFGFIVFFVLVRTDSDRLATFSLQLYIRTYGPFSTMKEEGANFTSMPLQLQVLQQRNDSIVGIDRKPIKLTQPSNRNPRRNSSGADTGAANVQFDLKETKDENKSRIGTDTTEQPLDMKDEPVTNYTAIDNSNSQNYGDQNTKHAENKSVDVKQEEVITGSGNIAPQDGEKLVCDFSEPRSDTCTMTGDIRVLPKSSAIILASPSQSITSENATIRIRPYARKWEAPVMQTIKEVTISPASDSDHAPPCSVKHNVPAIVFSTGGFLGNFFHDFTDVVIPLFVTSRQFQGEVQFLVTDFNSKWINKYQPLLKQLSRYEIINMDTEAQAHCFPKAQVGLLSHKVLGIDPSKTPNGYSMMDFKQFLRSCFNLNKDSANVTPKKSKKKPRLLMILRKGSRSLMNAKAVVAMARSVGFKVITAGPEETRDMAKFARMVNSCDAMMGVHGAGLANMVFLPTNASLVQIIPWGGLKWACWHDFGEPASDMGLHYVEYEIKEEESSLIQEYPRDHAVFKDPMSIHRQGWNQLWSIFLYKQKVQLDVSRFRVVLSEIYQSLKI